MVISTQTSFGPLLAGFSIDFLDGYNVLVGINDVGKSAILQLVFKRLMEDSSFGSSSVCLIPPERIFIDLTTEAGGRTLDQHNQEFYNSISGTTMLPYAGIVNPSKSELPKLLLGHSDFINQIDFLKIYLNRLEIPNVVLRRSQEITFEDIQIIFHGSGLRSIFAILCALTDPKIKVLLIDEPELSLEPRLQKSLRDLLYDISGEKTIIVSTHSHLFINRKSFSHNYKIDKTPEGVFSKQIADQRELNELIFDLLGNSLEDLFFPGNFLIVEGSSDQIILEKCINLSGIDSSRVKVISARGVTNTGTIYSAIENTLTPLEMHDSPYSKKAVVLIDKPKSSANLTELKKLEKRLFRLTTYSIEEYIPESVYTKMGKTKADELQKIRELDTAKRQDELNVYKKALSEQIVANLNVEDLDQMVVIKKAIKKAGA